VLHRLAQPQVGGQREGGQQLSQPQPRIPVTVLHTIMLEARTAGERIPAGQRFSTVLRQLAK